MINKPEQGPVNGQKRVQGLAQKNALAGREKLLARPVEELDDALSIHDKHGRIQRIEDGFGPGHLALGGGLGGGHAATRRLGF